MSAESRSPVVSLSREKSLRERLSCDHTTPLEARVTKQLRLAMPVVNCVSALLTFVFIQFVVLPLPKPAPPGRSLQVSVLATILLFGIFWIACALWSEQSFRPVKRWLHRGGEPDRLECARAIRFPLHQAGQAMIVWALAGFAVGGLSLWAGSSVASSVLTAVMVILGGLVASAWSYLVVEWLMRPVVALALESDPPERPLLPGIATRIYLAWEFGTAVAVGGAVVTAIAYLAGGGMSAERMAATVIFLGCVALTIGAVTIVVVTRSVADPIRAVRTGLARVEAGETGVTLPVDDGSEVGLLQAGFNRMVAGLRERDRVRDLFGRHVGEEVARSAIGSETELGGELRDAAVLFVDVIGSTSFAATRDPREVVETLNRFFGIVVEVVTVHGGWVNKFEGDAALCVFGAPTDHPDAAGAALAAARGLRQRLRRELDGLDAAIGLSAGAVVAGNIGAAKRYEYTVIGDPVNEASRLTELAKGRPCRLLASESILRRASEAEATRWELGEPVLLRGRSEATNVASPV